MPEWTCGRCTFINHELMTNCEMCDAPKEAAEIPYLGDPPIRSAENSFQSHEGSTETTTPMDHQTTEGPSADDMLDVRSEIPATNESSLQPEISPAHSLSEKSLEAGNSGGTAPLQQQSSLAGAVNGGQETSMLPEPLAPVVLHSLEVQEPMESPMSEPEHIEKAMCIPSPDKAIADEDNGWSFLENEVRLVLIGKTGVGKSTTGNNILGNNTFKSSASGSSVTKKCQLGWASRFSRDIQIIDTPGLFDTGMSNEDISREVVKCIGMTSPGPHAFVLVIRLDRFTAEEKATVDHFINIFGKDMSKYLIVLFTRMDDLKYDGTSLDEYVQNVPPDLRNLLQLCQQRYIGFDNRGTKEEKNQDVQNLLQMVDSMVKGSGGGHYTNEMFEEAERIIAEQEEEHMKRTREEMQREMERLRAEVEEELRRKDEKQQRELETMKGQLSELGVDEDEEWVQVLSMSPVEERDEPVKSLEVPVNHSKGPNGAASVPTVPVNSVMVNGDIQTVSEKQDNSGKKDTTERKSADDYFKASDAVSSPPGYCGSLKTQNGSMYQSDSSHSTQEVNTNRSFLSNEPQRPQSLGGQTEHDIQVQQLRERAVRMNEEHQRDKERMRAEYMARQSAAYDSYHRKHRESRQRAREEMNNINSNVFTRMFGRMKKFVLSITTPLGRGLQNLFHGVQTRSAGTHGESFF